MTLPTRTPGAHLLPVRLHQWYANGDHPDDDAAPGVEGRVVRRFRHPDHPGHQICHRCAHTLHEHGWIDSGAEGHPVCPGDFILTTTTGEYLPLPPSGLIALGKELLP